VSPKTIQKSRKFTLTAHAKERVRQRVGINSVEAAVAWVNEAIATAKDSFVKSRHYHYLTDNYEIITDGLTVITISPLTNHVDYATKFGSLIAKEATKLLAQYRKEFRKAEIAVAELTLNYLKAKSPKVRDSIKRKLTQATDLRAKIEDEIRAVKIAAEGYGIDIDN
jgi:hypothetical protein